MKVRSLFSLVCASSLALVCAISAENKQMTIPLSDAQDALTIVVSSTVESAIAGRNRAPRPPLDTGDSSSTGPVGNAFAPTTTSGVVLPDAWLTSGNTLGSQNTLGSLDRHPVYLVTNGTTRLTLNNAPVDGTGYVDLVGGQLNADGTRYIHKTGIGNFFAGESAGNTMTTGAYNTALGSNALQGGQTGIASVAVGSYALYNQAALAPFQEMYNTAVGFAAGYNITTGSNNTLLGPGAGWYLTTGSNNIYIGGFFGTGTVDNENTTIRIGNNSPALPATACYIQGIANVSVGDAPVYVDSNTGQLGAGGPSSIRYKENVAPLPSQERFMQLRPVSFNYKSDAKKNTQYGLIAEEVNKLYPELVIRDQDGQIQAVQYHKLDGIFIKEIQENRTRIWALQDVIAALQMEASAHKNLITSLQTETSIYKEQVTTLQQIVAAMKAQIEAL